MSIVAAQGIRVADGPRLQVHRFDPEHHLDERMAQRRDALAAEARRLLKRRAASRALACRCRPGIHGLSDWHAEELANRARRHAAQRHRKFFKTIEGLIEFGGFADARTLMNASRACG
jgi:hypothetical protein